MFLEKRVYQGSSGKVYPLPVIDRIAEQPTLRRWKAIWIENEFLRVLVLPEIGGRIHRIFDKAKNYDLIYYQPVIKPALVGLAGPWISGGIEFNWPQHHRPATFLPVDTETERHADGSATIWCGDHDPMCRMQGLHGVCLHPGRAYVELKARAGNRTPFTQTFLWWANVATRVHEAYQSFFPPDVYYVADHARRSMSEYPLAQGGYYGVNYGERGRKGVPPREVPGQFVPPHCVKSEVRTSDLAPNIPDYSPNDLSFYANIPVPTSYMCMGSKEDFFGGYDYQAQAGIVHIANHRLSPGKKQWTWGNHEFGYAWDRNLTDADANGEFAPYIEIMAGVYTDNQPDFSFLQPGETKSWSQFWYPIHKIGPAQHANLDAAIALRVRDCGSLLPRSKRAGGPAHAETRRSAVRVGVSVTRDLPQSRVLLLANGKRLLSVNRDLAPGKPFVTEIRLPNGVQETGLRLRVTDSDGREIIAYRPKPREKGGVPPPATEPPAPADIASSDELFLTGQHLDQYRHATRCPTLYWREALRRDPGDARSNNALGLWHLKRGEFKRAEAHFRQAIGRLTRRNANPYDGEPFYNLGLCLRYQADGLAKSENRKPKTETRTGARAAALRISDFELLSDFRLRASDSLSSAYDAFYKATWNQAWASAAHHALAEIDCRRREWSAGFDHLNRSLRSNTDNTRARNLKAIVLKKLGRKTEADALLRETMALDPLDWWTRHLLGEEMTCDTQTLLDLALDYARAGFYAEAIDLLNPHGARNSVRFNGKPAEDWEVSAGSRKEERRSGQKSTHSDDPRNLGTTPLVHYYVGWLHEQRARQLTSAGSDNFVSHMQHKVVADPTARTHLELARTHRRRAAAAPPDYCFPARLEDIAMLETAIAADPSDARAPYYLGNLLYDRRRHEEAIRLWERSAKLEPSFSVVWRNLGIGYFNIRRQPAKARAAYDKACRANPADARLLYERDQLWKRLGERPAKRLRGLEARPDLVRQRDDLSVELSALYNQVGRHADALALVSGRHFQPWEGGEGGPLGQWVRSHLALGRAALASGHAARAREHFEAALTVPRNLGEAKHLLANQSDIHYWLGCACKASGERKSAREHWLAAATFKGDFQEMSVRAFSEMTYYSALAWEQLRQKTKARKLLHDLLAYARKLQKTKARIDYFATSLPTMLLFDDDLPFRQETTALFLQAQAHWGLGRKSRACALLREVLRRDPNQALAADLFADRGSPAMAALPGEPATPAPFKAAPRHSSKGFRGSGDTAGGRK